jgi:biopolymer transport protein TolQ
MDTASPETSIVSLILQASVLVQMIMALLLLASLFSWYVIFRKRSQLANARRLSRTFEDRFWSGMELGELFRQASRERVREGLASVFVAGFGEYVRLRQQPNPNPEECIQAANRAMRAAQLREIERLEEHLPSLATIGSVAPYVGLFGTVWGIMHSFQGLAKVQQATLSMVAPGISEALIATAMGLFAAIPAVVAYNRYAAQIGVLVTQMDGFRDEFSNILQRNLSPAGEGSRKLAGADAP